MHVISPLLVQVSHLDSGRGVLGLIYMLMDMYGKVVPGPCPVL